MADKSKAAEIRDEVAAFIEEQQLYFMHRKATHEQEMYDERIRQASNEWDEGDKEA